MRLIADLHIHSRFSRATSRELTLPELHARAQRKGIGLLGTGDVTHPVWLEELAEQLVPAEEGFFRLRPELERASGEGVPAACRRPVRFVLQGEISSIYKHRGGVRKVHSVVFLPGFAAARRLLGTLDRLGNVRSDGRPILGLSCRDLLEVVLDSGPGACLVPAHVWTPWFSLLGSKSGYDGVAECFEDLAGEVFALETGLSSDPAMNWRVSALDPYALLSNSDAHSAANLGREANEFDLDPGYAALFGSLRRRGDPGFLGTLEFFPEEGKYHLDGHRTCGRRLTPGETRAAGGVCPACGGKVTVGVLHRVEELADRPEGERPEGARSFTRLVPLAEVVGECLGVGARAGRVGQVCARLEAELGPELDLLRSVPVEEIRRRAGPVVGEAVARVRREELLIAPGYDGEFGTIRIFRPEERRELSGRRTLFVLDPEAVEEPVPGGSLVGSSPRSFEGAPAFLRSRPGPAGQAPDLLAELNEEQREAVLAAPGPLVIVAGPGTGKTRTVACRIAHKVLSGAVPPEGVAALTFTNRAAAELRERLEALLPGAGARARVCTMHRLGLELLRDGAAAAGLPTDFRLFGEEEGLELLRTRFSLGHREAKEALAAVSLARRSGTAASPATALAAAYDAELREQGAVDLDGLLPKVVGALGASPELRCRWQGRFRHVVVDEFQDLDPVQYRLLECLAPGESDVTVIGDPDQAIYGFRGAAPELLRRFGAERARGRVVELVRNYRSTAPVLHAASRMLAAGGSAGGRGLLPMNPSGPAVRSVAAPTDRGEAEFVVREVERLVGGTSHAALRCAGLGSAPAEAATGFGEIAVLYRLRAQRLLLEEAFERAGIPYRTIGEEPLFLRGKGRALLRMLRGEAPGGSAAGAVKRAAGSLGLCQEEPGASSWLSAAAGAGTVEALLERVALHRPEDDWEGRAERVTLLTLHAAKGLEFHAVFVVGCEEGLVPFRKEGEDPEGSLGEERRLFYVGMTRARRLLYLTRAERRRMYGKTLAPEPSRFLAGLGDLLEETRLAAEAGPDRPRQLRLL